ncbi:hypothetical protein A2307_00965 [Candidatus Peregrinibacteria bacterium RIFOXYB2_FULL_33_20]|nr:MAG: hypothetical protein A2307_00965 [Candidatus Peregrinibacteria bacterium RIFOXYB2_FULL_33_20]
MESPNQSPYFNEDPAALEQIQREANQAYLARALNEIQKSFGLNVDPSADIYEAMKQARDRLDQNFEAYIASLSSRNLDNLGVVIAELEKFRALVARLDAEYDRTVDLIRSVARNQMRRP